MPIKQNANFKIIYLSTNKFSSRTMLTVFSRERKIKLPQAEV